MHDYSQTHETSHIDAAGLWRYSWIGAGAAEGAEQGVISVRPRASA